MLEHKHFKQILIYALLCIYSFALLKPIVPVVKDIFAHTFFKLNHLATVHYENGKYHLHKELLSEQKGEKKENVPAFTYETLANHIGEATLKIKALRFLSQLITSQETHNPLDVFIKKPSPPPKA